MAFKTTMHNNVPFICFNVDEIVHLYYDIILLLVLAHRTVMNNNNQLG